MGYFLLPAWFSFHSLRDWYFLGRKREFSCLRTSVSKTLLTSFCLMLRVECQAVGFLRSRSSRPFTETGKRIFHLGLKNLHLLLRRNQILHKKQNNYSDKRSSVRWCKNATVTPRTICFSKSDIFANWDISLASSVKIFFPDFAKRVHGKTKQISGWQNLSLQFGIISYDQTASTERNNGKSEKNQLFVFIFFSFVSESRLMHKE